MWTLILFVLGWVFVISWLDTQLARAGFPPLLTWIYFLGVAIFLGQLDEPVRHAIGDEMRAAAAHISALMYSPDPGEQMLGVGIIAIASLILLFPIVRDVVMMR